MRSFLIFVLIILGLFALFKKFAEKVGEVEKRGSSTEQKLAPPANPSASTNLPGLPASIEPALQAAQKQGAEGLKNFLNRYSYAIQDPRLAAIQLDYVVLISLQDPAEAKRVFKAVQQRTPTWSPVYGRIKSLEKNYP